ncbi:MAG: SGNH/GDSL hydrolase family protein [Myxococcota bacterium]
MLQLALLSLFACGPRVPKHANMLAIGDSILAAHAKAGASIPHVAAARTGHVVHNVAINGAELLEGGAIRAIPLQRVAGKWDWLVMNGGGNDLNGRCGCGDCRAVLDQQISADATSGALVDIVKEAVASGTRVLFMGYPELPPGARFGFDRCDDILVEQKSRIATLARNTPQLWFVDAADVIDAADLQLFVEDRVHPNREGSRVMGEYIAKTIESADESDPD